MKYKLTARELSSFCGQMGMLLHSGISTAEGLHILCDESKTDTDREILTPLIRSVEETGSLSQALEESGYFPKSMTAYVKTGEETGCLDEVLKSLSEHYDQEIEISENIRSAITYPLIMLAMMGTVIIILLVKVLPVFQQVFRQMGLEMNHFSNGLLNAGNVISRYSAVLLILILIITAGFSALFFTEKGRFYLRRLSGRLPCIKDIPISADYARLTQAIAMGIHSGLDHVVTLEMAQKLLSHQNIREKAKKAQKLLEDGVIFEDALSESGLFEGLNARLITVGLRTGTADEVMSKLAIRYREMALTITGNILSIAEPSIVIIFSLLVGLVLLSVMMPLLGILSEIVM